MAENAVILCSPSDKKYNYSKPFTPIISKSVDLFPHTNHCEMIVLFERSS
jgi:tRNA (uracil-5-)-methyltransferase